MNNGQNAFYFLFLSEWHKDNLQGIQLSVKYFQDTLSFIQQTMNVQRYELD